MDLVSRHDVGVVALDRMLRDRVVAPVAPGLAAPLDLPVTPADRARAVAGAVPSHTVVSALAGLWIHLGYGRPTVLDVVGAPGLHRAPPGSHPEGWRIVFHSGAAVGEVGATFGALRVATPTRCCADALRWDDLGVAIPAVLQALRATSPEAPAIRTPEIALMIARADSRGSGAARMRGAWAAIEDACRR